MIKTELKRVLFVDHLPFRGGAQLVWSSFINQTDGLNFTYFLVTDKKTNYDDLFTLPKQRINKIDFERLKGTNPVSLVKLLRSVNQLSEVVKKVKPDLIVSNTTRAFIITALCDFKGPKLANILDYDYPKWLFNLLKSQFTRFICVSVNIKNYYLLQDKVEVIYVRSNMVDRVKKITSAEPKQFRQQWGFKKDDFVVGFIGRLVGWKGAHDVIQAVEKVGQTKVKLLIVGTGEGQEDNIEPNLKSYVSTNKLEEKVKFTGHFKDVPLVYKSIDLMILASQKPEPFATTMIEAAESKVPIVAATGGGTTEFIEDGVTGLLYLPGDVGQLSDRLIELVENDSLRRKLIENAFQKSQDYTDQVIIPKVEAIYLKALATNENH